MVNTMSQHFLFVSSLVQGHQVYLAPLTHSQMNNSIKFVIANLTPKLDLLDLFEFFLHFMAKSGVDAIWLVDSARLNILALGRDITLYCHIETDVNETFCFVTFSLTTPCCI